MTSSPYSRLSDRDSTIVNTIQRYRQVSSAQLLRLCFADNSERSRRQRMCRSLKRLTKWGVIARIPRMVGGHAGGSSGYVYTLPGSRSRSVSEHTLDIVDLYIQLVEQQRLGRVGRLVFDPEKYAYQQIGHVEFVPDAYIRLEQRDGAVDRFFIEVDRGTRDSGEWKVQLKSKMRRYILAYDKWRDGTFPLVVFTVLDDDRRRFIEGVVKTTEMPGLFTVILYNEAIPYLIGDM